MGEAATILQSLITLLREALMTAAPAQAGMSQSLRSATCRFH
jgi:hypothetical protein